MFGRNKEKTELTGIKKETKDTETMKKDGKEVCPCCDRHCPADDLHCSKGRKHFGLADDKGGEDAHEHRKHGERGERRHPLDESQMTAAGVAYTLLRSCGHYLHHAAGEGDPDKMFAVLSEEEKKELNSLLKKVLKSWEEK